MNHPFVVKLHYAFQTSTRLFLIVDLLQGVSLILHRENCSTSWGRWRSSMRCWPGSTLLRYCWLFSTFTAKALSIGTLSLKMCCWIVKAMSRYLTLGCPRLCTAPIKRPTRCAERLSTLLLRSSWGKGTLRLLIGLALGRSFTTCSQAALPFCHPIRAQCSKT